MSVGSALMFPYTFMPILSTPSANQDVWIAVLLMLPYILLLNLPILILVNRFRGLRMNEILEITLGKIFGKSIAFLYALFFLFCLSACSLIMVKFLALFIFNDTPTWALLIYMLVPVCYASWKGAGTIARLAYFIVPLMILVSVLFFLMGLEQMDLNNLRPILADSTFLQLNQSAFYTGARYSEILILFVFAVYFHQKVKINKTYGLILVVFGLCFLIILFPTLLVLGFDLAKHAWNPYWLFSRQVDVYDFIQKVQSINLLVWFPGTILKLTLYNYMGSFTLSGIFNTKTHRGFVIPLALIAFILCINQTLNRSDVIELLRSDKIFPYIVLPFTLVLPLIILIVYLIRRKKIDAIVKHKQMANNVESLTAGQSADFRKA